MHKNIILESLGAVTHTHTHTHTYIYLNNKIGTNIRSKNNNYAK